MDENEKKDPPAEEPVEEKKEEAPVEEPKPDAVEEAVSATIDLAAIDTETHRTFTFSLNVGPLLGEEGVTPGEATMLKAREIIQKAGLSKEQLVLMTILGSCENAREAGQAREHLISLILLSVGMNAKQIVQCLRSVGWSPNDLDDAGEYVKAGISAVTALMEADPKALLAKGTPMSSAAERAFSSLRSRKKTEFVN